MISLTAIAFFLMRGGAFGMTGRGRRNRVLRAGRRHAGSLCEENIKMIYLLRSRNEIIFFYLA